MKKWVVMTVVIALGAGTFFLLQPSEEKKIRKRFGELTGLLDKEGDEGTFAAAGRAKAISGLFTDPVRLAGAPMGLEGTYDDQELMAIVLHGRARFQSMDADIADLEIEINGPDTAAAHFTAQLAGTVSGERIREVREVRCGLTRLEGQWVIGAVEFVEVIRR